MRLRYFFFFFQAEDGIRDLTVTGVQTCALPISPNALQQLQVSPEARGTRSHCSAAGQRRGIRDRKSTRLNSSHSQISYAVFCLKKKKNPPPLNKRNDSYHISTTTTSRATAQPDI